MVMQEQSFDKPKKSNWWQVYIKGLKIYIPMPLKKDLDILIDDMINSEMDILLVIDGKEGSGKSRTGRIIGSYIAGAAKVPFSEKNIHFTTDDYIITSERGYRFQINVLDESREALNRKRSMSSSNVRFSNWLSENRDKQQVHILILPAIHDLDSYVSCWRTSLLIHHIKKHIRCDKSKSGYKLERGFIKVYPSNRHLQGVINNKAKYGYYAYPKLYKYLTRIYDCEPLTEEQLALYKKKKSEKRSEKYDGIGTTKINYMPESINCFERLLVNMNKKENYSYDKLKKLSGFSPAQISKIINKDLIGV